MLNVGEGHHIVEVNKEKKNVAQMQCFIISLFCEIMWIWRFTNVFRIVNLSNAVTLYKAHEEYNIKFKKKKYVFGL